MSRRIRGKMAITAAALILVALLAAGCAAKPAAKSGTVTVTGSTSVQPLADMLAQAYESHNLGVKINVAGGGSSVGIKAAADGTTDIGMSSRELKTEEKNLHETVIAKDGIAIAVNPANPVSNLTVEQVKKMYTGEITNWKDVGGNDAEIVLVAREASSGTRGAFEEIVLGKALMVDTALIQGSTGAAKTTVVGNVNAISYISSGSLSSDVKALKIDGVDVSAATVLDGTYKIARPFLLVTKSVPDGLAKDFIDFALSEEGQTIVGDEKYVRVR